MAETCLLDTHVLLWAVCQPHRLHEEIRMLVERNQYVVSVASLWEFINKKGRSDAPIKNPSAWWDSYVVRPKTPVLPIRPSHVLYLDDLPMLHKDPFDRIMIAQSVVEHMPLVTEDANIRKYRIDLRTASGA
jgi:PIN domain nuclease of toxin-antitoxin system